MHKIKMLAIAPYDGMAEILEAIAKERDDIDLTIRVGDLQVGLELAKSMLQIEDFDIILSRGGTAELLRNHLPLPVIEIPFTVYDLLCSLKMLDDYNGKYAITGFKGITDNAKILCDVLEKDIRIVTFSDQKEVLPSLKELKNEGYSLVVCDMISQSIASTIGLNALFVSSGADSIRSAMNDAIQFISSVSELYKQVDLYKEALVNNDDSILIVNQQNEIVFSSLSKTSDDMQVLEELQTHIDKYTCATNNSNSLVLNNYIYHITKKEIFHQDEPFSLLTISKATFLFEPEDKTVSRYDNYSETISDHVLNNSSSLVGSTSEILEKFAATTLPVVIAGEAGTGKEKTAALLYHYGVYRNKAFSVIDCKLMTEKKWKILLSGEDSPLTQIHSSIHFKNIERLSSSQLESLYDYIVGSKLLTRNRVTFSLINNDEKSNDICNHLVNRLSCLLFPLTPLRERQEDIRSIAALYINEMNASLGKQIIGFKEDAFKLILEYHWPQNLDQFHRVLKELFIRSDTSYITADNVKLILSQEKKKDLPSIPANSSLDLTKSLEEITYEVILQVLAEEKGSKEKAAQRLGISRTTLWRILKNNA